MTFTLPENPVFPLEVETVGGFIAIIDSDQGSQTYPFLGRVVQHEGDHTQNKWTISGKPKSGHSNLILKPLFVPVIPDFVPDGWWVVKCSEGGISICSAEPQEHDSGQFLLCGGKKVRNMEVLNWDWNKTFHPSWDWTKCKLQKKGE